ncbi:uncharacterized protein N0V89_011253 [Didymosphaeria variabile]|uniref:DUF7025 domain-containing protein n=1 Tax=Didymosphaeria variabile TaxID=1932322 RepID=A0A9W8XD51_9PLEO|nr:uncharacterized protein N0V89_011253 [Didymosphaeria variabile]KAJ4347313.1 hypothetical protein N0V89_011253 [Didymosphaeria variabile]
MLQGSKAPALQMPLNQASGGTSQKLPTNLYAQVGASGIGNDDTGYGFGDELKNDDDDIVSPNKRQKVTNVTTDDGSEHVQSYYTLSRDQTAANDDSKSRLRALGDPSEPHKNYPLFENRDERESIGNRLSQVQPRQWAPTISSGQFQNRLNTEQLPTLRNVQQNLSGVSRANGDGSRKDFLTRKHNDRAEGKTLPPMGHEDLLSVQDNTNSEPKELPHMKSTRSHRGPESNIQLEQAATRTGNVEGQGGSLTTVTPSTDTQQKKLMDRIRFLEKENTRLKNPEAQTNILLIYHIMDNGSESDDDSTPYLDARQWSIGGGQVFLRAEAPLADLEGYIQRMTGIAFVVNKYYKAHQQAREIEQSERNNTALPSPVPIRETILLKSTRMLEAMTAYMKETCGFTQQFPDFDSHRPIVFPYLFWFWDRRTKAFRNLGPEHQTYLFALTTWIENSYCDLYDRVEKELSEETVSNDPIPFLFKPEETVVIKKEQTWVAGVVTHCASHKRTEQQTVSEFQSVKDDDDSAWGLVSHLHDRSMQKTVANRSAQSSSKNTKQHEVWNVKYWTYAYDGSFYRVERHVDVLLPTAEKKGVRELDAYPIRYASKDNTERFMVDFGTYRELHSKSTSFNDQYPLMNDSSTRRMSARIMEADHPPQGAELYAFPANIVGYNLRSKKWST